MNKAALQIAGAALVVGGLVYPIPALTRSEAIMPVVLKDPVTIGNSDEAWVVATDAVYSTDASGFDLLAHPNVAWGLLAIALGFCALVAAYEHSREDRLVKGLGTWTSITLIVAGVLPGLIMQQIDQAAFGSLGAEVGELGYRKVLQAALLICVVGILGLFSTSRTYTPRAETDKKVSS